MSVSNQKSTSTVPLIAGGLGGLVIAAAQTKPEDAISNIGGWLKLIGVDQTPSFLIGTHIDAWLTVVGFALVAGSGLMFWHNKRTKRLASAAKEIKQIKDYSRKSFNDYRERRFIEKQSSPQPRANIGTLGAAIFGVDSANSKVSIDYKNFGDATAHIIQTRMHVALCDAPPEHISHWQYSNGEGIIEQGHTQSLTRVLGFGISSAQIQSFRRGGHSLYAVLEIDYDAGNENSYRRVITYYLHPEGIQKSDRVMLNSCDTGNRETPIVKPEGNDVFEQTFDEQT